MTYFCMIFHGIVAILTIVNRRVIPAIFSKGSSTRKVRWHKRFYVYMRVLLTKLTNSALSLDIRKKKFC